jgi:hypothetical protein
VEHYLDISLPNAYFSQQGSKPLWLPKHSEIHSNVDVFGISETFRNVGLSLPPSPKLKKFIILYRKNIPIAAANINKVVIITTMRIGYGLV